MANISTLNTVAAATDAVATDLSGPRGKKPKKRFPAATSFSMARCLSLPPITCFRFT
ncbi:hypothetical protein AGR1C_Lc20327 [Agrobacterium fabacearum TT111]|nr:hypothetical protein AGR1C_Lc20327 [Agrobacterium fabacearum TT111]